MPMSIDERESLIGAIHRRQSVHFPGGEVYCAYARSIVRSYVSSLLHGEYRRPYSVTLLDIDIEDGLVVLDNYVYLPIAAGMPSITDSTVYLWTVLDSEEWAPQRRQIAEIAREAIAREDENVMPNYPSDHPLAIDESHGSMWGLFADLDGYLSNYLEGHEFSLSVYDQAIADSLTPPDGYPQYPSWTQLRYLVAINRYFELAGFLSPAHDSSGPEECPCRAHDLLRHVERQREERIAAERERERQLQQAREESRRQREAEERERERRYRLTCHGCNTYSETVPRTRDAHGHGYCPSCLERTHMRCVGGCRRWFRTEYMVALIRYGHARACRDCLNASYARCSVCHRYYDPARDEPCCAVAVIFPERSTEDVDCTCECENHCNCNGCELNCDCECEEHRSDYYSDDDSDDSNGVDIHDYSYHPDPVFHGKHPHGLYLGLELELATRDGRFETAREARKLLGGHAYIKADGSISYGWELVTHPMTYEYARNKFPWRAIDELKAMGCRADDTTGMHVHASKRAFSGPDHDYRWLMFWYRNARSMGKLARRNPSRWGAFNDEDRKSAVDIAKKAGTNNSRYSAINAQPSATYEVRIFASTVQRGQILAALALVDSTIEYTRQLRATDIIRRKGWEFDTFISWLADKPQYEPLLTEWNRICAS